MAEDKKDPDEVARQIEQALRDAELKVRYSRAEEALNKLEGDKTTEQYFRYLHVMLTGLVKAEFTERQATYIIGVLMHLFINGDKP